MPLRTRFSGAYEPDTQPGWRFGPINGADYGAAFKALYGSHKTGSDAGETTSYAGLRKGDAAFQGKNAAVYLCRQPT